MDRKKKKRKENYELNEWSHPAPFQSFYLLSSYSYNIISYFLVNPSIYKPFFNSTFLITSAQAKENPYFSSQLTSSSLRQAPCSNHSLHSHIGAVLFFPGVCVCVNTQLVVKLDRRYGKEPVPPEMSAAENPSWNESDVTAMISSLSRAIEYPATDGQERSDPPVKQELDKPDQLQQDQGSTLFHI